ncbi:MAG: ABC transporter, partial [Burkholderiales bacterium]|nr:ABC transporter [Burkholderiales bacterium]
MSEAPNLDRLRTLAFVLKFARPYQARVAAFTVALIVAAGCFLALGQGLKIAVDRGFAAGDPSGLDQGLIFLLIVVMISAGATYTRFYLISWLGERIVADLRRAVFERLLTLAPSWFEHSRTGAMVSRLTTDTALIEQVVGTSVSMALRNAMMGLGALVMLAVTSGKLTALVLLLVPLVIGPIV